MKKQKFNLWIIPAVVLGITAAASIIVYAITLNMMLILAILPSIGGVGFCVYKVANFGNVRYEGISEKGPAVLEANTMTIYGRQLPNGERKAAAIEFEELEDKNLVGDRWYFKDLNKWLYVRYNDLDDKDTMKAFELPDAAYTDPARLAIQINMGRTNELFQLDPTLFDQLKPWILVACISIVGFMIFLSGSG